MKLTWVMLKWTVCIQKLMFLQSNSHPWNPGKDFAVVEWKYQCALHLGRFQTTEKSSDFVRFNKMERHKVTRLTSPWGLSDPLSWSIAFSFKISNSLVFGWLHYMHTDCTLFRMKWAKLEHKWSITEQECRVRAEERTLIDRGYQMCCTPQMKDYLLAQRLHFHTHQ